LRRHARGLRARDLVEDPREYYVDVHDAEFRLELCGGQLSR
jgi:hypothetical protein